MGAAEVQTSNGVRRRANAEAGQRGTTIVGSLIAKHATDEDA